VSTRHPRELKKSIKVTFYAIRFPKCANGTLLPLTGEWLFGSMAGTPKRKMFSRSELRNTKQRKP
jgi:hypothetical protein